MILAITGGRYDPTTGRVLVPPASQLAAFRRLLCAQDVHMLVHGDAIGTDRAVAQYVAVQFHDVEIEIRSFPIVRRLDGEFPIAGHRRNRRMLRDSHAHGLVAFPGGSGTANCTSEALAIGLSVWEWDDGESDFSMIQAWDRP